MPSVAQESQPDDNSFDFHEDLPTDVKPPSVVVDSLKPWNGQYVDPRRVGEDAKREQGAASYGMRSHAGRSSGGRASKMRVGSFGTQRIAEDTLVDISVAASFLSYWCLFSAVACNDADEQDRPLMRISAPNMFNDSQEVGVPARYPMSLSGWSNAGFLCFRGR